MSAGSLVGAYEPSIAAKQFKRVKRCEALCQREVESAERVIRVRRGGDRAADVSRPHREAIRARYVVGRVPGKGCGARVAPDQGPGPPGRLHPELVERIRAAGGRAG